MVLRQHVGLERRDPPRSRERGQVLEEQRADAEPARAVGDQEGDLRARRSHRLGGAESDQLTLALRDECKRLGVGQHDGRRRCARRCRATLKNRSRIASSETCAWSSCNRGPSSLRSGRTTAIEPSASRTSAGPGSSILTSPNLSVARRGLSSGAGSHSPGRRPPTAGLAAGRPMPAGGSVTT